MGVLTGGLSFTRYNVVGQEPDPFWQTIDEKIRAFAFRDMESGTDEVCRGWVALQNMLDNEFKYASYACGDYLAFSFRVDRKSIPGALLKKKVMEEEQRVKDESNRKRISRQELSELRERARIGLLSKTLAVPSLYDVLWSASQKWLIFTGVSGKIRTEFEEYFKQCFELELIPYRPWELASAPEAAVKNLMHVEPEQFLD